MATWFELGTDGPAKILVGVDGSDTSMRAGAYAAGMARRQGRTSSRSTWRRPAVSPPAWPRPPEHYARPTTASPRSSAPRPTMPASASASGSRFVQRRGNPYLELVRVAEELRVDAIVVGASMQSGHRLVGSLAGRLVRDAKWPITVVP